MVGILEEVFVGSFRHFGVTAIARAHFPNTYNTVQKEIHSGYLPHTVALAVWWKEVDVAADATKCILSEFERGFSVGVVDGNQHEVGNRFDELTAVGMLFKNRGMCCKPDLPHVLVLGTNTLFLAGMSETKPADVTEARNYGKSFIYQVPTLFLAINSFQKTNNPFPGVIFK